MLETLQNAPLRNKLRFVVVGTALGTLILVMALYIAYEWVAVNQQLHEDLSARAEIIAANSTAALVFNDPSAAAETLTALQATPEVVFACIYRFDGNGSTPLFASYPATNAAKSCPVRAPELSSSSPSGHMRVRQDIVLAGTPTGSLIIESDLRQLWQRITTVGWASLVILLLVTSLAIALSRLVERAIAEPVGHLHAVMQQVARSSDYTLRATQRNAGQDEVGALVEGFNQMLAKIDLRDGELLHAQAELKIQIAQRDQANAELNRTMQQLRSTQDQLVQSEKMASLGGLVAGIAHEINTPVGVAFTAASTLQTRSKDLKADYQDGNIRRSTLDRYVDQAVEIGDMIVKNLARAAELIQSFKQVAVDQTSSERRRFDLHEYIDETLVSLRPRLKKLPHTVHVDCPEDIAIDGYPGAISQILTNLVLNSVTHAFEGREGGNIWIQATIADDEAFLSYRDDGVGMDAVSKKQIFDPFFTTKRGRGGSGLGMHVVFNLVTQTLGGSITMPPTDQGIAFDIRFPRKAPT